MPTIDNDRDTVVIRIVFDGAPESGKTTSLRALGKSLGTSVETPGEEDGRTVWFDWMEYVGGFFEGRSIRCQVVTVPGQVWFWERRRRLLLDADAVIFVADSQSDRIEGSIQALQEMRELLADQDVPPGLILQANKRDLEGALPLDEMRELLADGEPIAVTESVARDGVGIREAFILAVRLALDRVRGLAEIDRLESGPPSDDGADALLARLQRADPSENLESLLPSQPVSTQPVHESERSPRPRRPEAGSATASVSDDAATKGASEAKRSDPSDTPASAAGDLNGAPLPPDSAVASGLIWPPVGGRTILHEAVDRELRLRRLAGGAWADFGNRWWLVQSPGNCLYNDEVAGRKALVSWARWHTSLQPYLSSQRSVVLSPAGRGGWRLWQIVRRREPLASSLAEVLERRDPEGMARSLAEAVRGLDQLRERPEIRHLGPSIDTVTLEEGRPVLLSLMPPPPEADGDGEMRDRSATDGERAGESPLSRWLGRELERWSGGLGELRSASRTLSEEDAAAVRALLAGASDRGAS